MRVLFVPHAQPGVAHLIPLVALDKMVAGSRIETAFLVPRVLHKILRDAGANVLDVDHEGFATEMQAYSYFDPDVLVDDCSYSTSTATALTKVPRVTMLRTGMFPGAAPRNKSHHHSLTLIDNAAFADVTFLGLPQPESGQDFFRANIHIIPGIKSIEVLPPRLREDESFVYSGPLIMNDYMVSQLGVDGLTGLNLSGLRNFDSLKKFFAANRDRRIIYVTFGTEAAPRPQLLDSISHLLKSDMAVITNIKLDGLGPAEQALYYYASYLPMHFVCSNVDLVIHHCGSGTYHYPILHNVPSITIGTQCYDREDVALRLEELGVSIHIPSPDECDHSVEAIRLAIEKYFEPSGTFFLNTMRNLSLLNEEIKQTSSSFDFEAVLNRALA